MFLSNTSQYFNVRLEDGLIFLLMGSFGRALLRGWNKHFLDGILITLCRSCPTSFWNFFNNRDDRFRASLIYFLRFCTLISGREMQNVRPLNIYTKSSFYVHHVTSPSRKLFIAIESPPMWTDMWGGKKTSYINTRMALTTCLRRALEEFCSIPMKLPT